ncbi:nuclear transcription factor Y subunit B-6-like [Rutidosis leptorrhynchoides]|uniref:nuclear transcription factor Y subunit B-6-like n=1 Tax=Rutidosis leptorrhynchoides TaxID=125765 RepID=UPI003A993A11
MPIANVIRIMRKILPPHAKISDDAKETIQECVSEYISFITGEANDRCQREQRKTITAEDVLYAMSKLGFDDYVEPLTLYLHRYRELEGDRAGGSHLRDMRPRATTSSSSANFSGYHNTVPTGFFGGGGYNFKGAAGSSNNDINNASGPSISHANGDQSFTGQPK